MSETTTSLQRDRAGPSTDASTDAAPQLVLDDVAITRGGRFLQHGISHRVSAGQITVLMGPNGCGKSSLIRAIAGRLPLAHGTINCTVPMLYVGHADGLSSALSGRVNLTNWAGLYGYNAHPAAIDAALDLLEATGFADMPIGQLSRGQRRRTSLARLSLAPAESLWLLDEPNVGLDAASVALLDSLVIDHLAHGGMVFAATHLPLGPPDAAQYLILDDPVDVEGPAA